MGKFLKVYKDFSGGLCEDANDNMKDNQLVSAINTVPGERYGLKRAGGTAIAFPAQTPDTGEIKALLDFKPAGQPIQTLCFTGKNFYKWDSTVVQWALIAPLSHPLRDYFVYGGNLYWLNGVDMQIYDGSAVAPAALSNSNPSAELIGRWNKVKASSFVEQRGQRWYYAQENDNWVVFSEVGKPCEMNLSNMINVNTKNADTITGLKEFSEGILIFKAKSVHYLTGWDFINSADLKLSQLNVTSGTLYDKSIQVVENAVLYLGYNGVYQLSLPYYTTAIASKNISDGLIGDTLRDNGTMDAYSEVWDNVYYLTLVNGQGIKEYRYYTILKSFWGEFTQNATCYSAAMSENALFIGCKNGYILKYQESSNHYIDINVGDETVIPLKAVTKGLDVMGSMVQDSKVKKLLIGVKQYAAKSSHMTLRVKADYNDQQWQFATDLDESLVYGEGSFGQTIFGWQDTVTKEFPINRKTKRIQVSFISDNVAYRNEPIMIYGFVLLYKKKRPKGNRLGITRQTPDYEG